MEIASRVQWLKQDIFFVSPTVGEANAFEERPLPSRDRFRRRAPPVLDLRATAPALDQHAARAGHHSPVACSLPFPCDAYSCPLCVLLLRAAGRPPARATGRLAPCSPRAPHPSPSEMYIRSEGVYI